MNDPRERVAGLALFMASRPLWPIAGWPPVGALVETARDAMHGGGVSTTDARRLRVWPSRWLRVARPVRHFYASLASNWHDVPETTARALTAAFWRILEPGDKWRRMDAHHYRTLRRVWIDAHGFAPVAELVPQIDDHEPPNGDG